jgi:hypothetical protein
MGSSCECGHQACYHVPEQENEGIARRELNALMARVVSLERELERERSGRNAPVHERIIAVEEAVENFKAEQEENTKTMYRAMAGAYNSIRHYQANNSKRFLEYDDKIDGVADKTYAVGDELDSVQKHVGRIEDNVMGLEDRLEDVESEADVGRTESGRPRKRIKTEPREPKSSSPSKHNDSDVETMETDEDPATADRESIVDHTSGLQQTTTAEVVSHGSAPPSDPPPPITPETTIPESPPLSQESKTVASIDDNPPFRLPPIPQSISEAPIEQTLPEPESLPAQPPSPSLTPVDLDTSQSPSILKRISDLPSPSASVSLTPVDFAPITDTAPPLAQAPPATSTTSSPHSSQSISGTNSPRGFKRATVCRTAPGVRCQDMCEGQIRRGVV